METGFDAVEAGIRSSFHMVNDMVGVRRHSEDMKRRRHSEYVKREWEKQRVG